MASIGDERANFLVDNTLGIGQSIGPGLAVLLAGFGEIVDAVQVDAELVADRGVEITWHRQIENEQRTLVTAARDVLLEVGQRDDVAIGARGAHDQIGRRKFFEQFIPWRSAAFPFGGERLGRGRNRD